MFFIRSLQSSVLVYGPGDALLESYFVLKVYLCGSLGHMALHGCHFSTVQDACSSANKGVI